MGENFSLRFNPCHGCFQILLLLFYMYVCMLAPMYYIEHGSQMITSGAGAFFLPWMQGLNQVVRLVHQASLPTEPLVPHVQKPCN